MLRPRLLLERQLPPQWQHYRYLSTITDNKQSFYGTLRFRLISNTQANIGDKTLRNSIWELSILMSATTAAILNTSPLPNHQPPGIFIIFTSYPSALKIRFQLQILVTVTHLSFLHRSSSTSDNSCSDFINNTK